MVILSNHALRLQGAQGKFPHRVVLLDRMEKGVGIGTIDAHALNKRGS